jgi:hypothetical protein
LFTGVESGPAVLRGEHNAGGSIRGPVVAGVTRSCIRKTDGSTSADDWVG